MTNMIQDRERIHEYQSSNGVKIVLNENGLELDDCDYLSAITLPTGVMEIQGVATPVGMPTKSLRVFYIETGPTGFFQARGGERIVFINIEDYVDYQLISDIHTVPDAEVYLVLTAPWESGRDTEFEHREVWFRDETFTEEFKED